MYLNKITFCFIVALLLLLIASPRNIYAQKDTLAVVNGNVITGDEFRNRFELSVYPGKDFHANMAKVKQQFLASMVAEKLLSNAASYYLPGINSRETYIRDETEKIFLRDALYRKEIIPNAEIKDDDLVKGVKLSSYFYLVDAFYFDDSLIASKFLNKLGHKKNNSIYYLADSLNVHHDTLQIGYGQSTQLIENAFWGHNAGFISKPTLTEDGWVIFKVLRKDPDKKFTSMPITDRVAQVSKIIKNREEDLLGYKYLLSVMKSVKVQVDYSIFRPLVYAIQDLLKPHKPASFDPGYYLSPNEIIALQNKFAGNLSSNLLQFNNGGITLEYALDHLTIDGFAPADTTIGEITSSLHQTLKFMAQNHFLAAKAKELGLQNSEEVKYNVQMFIDAFRSASLAASITDTVEVTEAQTLDFFENHKDEVLNDVMLKLKIYLVNNLDQASEVLNKLSKTDQNIQDTSGVVTIRASQLGELGALLAEMKDGSVYGPVFVKNQYVIYKIFGKISFLRKKAIEHSIQVAKDILLQKRKSEVLNKYISKLADEQNAKIYINKLTDVKVTPIEMLTVRYIGFGGKIMAVPSLYPREGWIKYIHDKNNILP